MNKCRHILPFLLILGGIATIVSCSNKKNTAQSRWWHAFTGRYNTYYNGTLAYIDASEEKEKDNKDNFTERLPLYTVGNKTSLEIGKANYDRAIEKCQKTIKLHSITAHPEWTKNRKKTEKDIEWLSRKEYNPFLWRAWLLMGRSQFYKGAFDEAASTFTYMCRLYKTQPAIYGKARAWLAKCYIEQNWMYDAEDVIRNMQRDSIDWRAQKEWDYTYTDYYLHTGDLDKAATYLRKVIKHEMRSKQRAREYYLLGQLEGALGHKDLAYKAFKKVLSQNPPYETQFNARIAMTEVLANDGQARKMIGKLRHMASDDNNKDYLDQVYYAIGNIYLAQKDTTNAIAAYEKGNEKATRSGIEKGVLLLHLGDLYWTKEKFSDARRCYGEAIGLLDKERDDYQQLSERSKVLDELCPYTDAVYLQDSLQALAKMSEKDRNEAIDRVIKALKKKEKEEKDKAAEADIAAAKSKYDTGNNDDGQTTVKRNTNTGSNKSTWYFYNATTVQQGKQTFQRKWGKRENADNWQRANKSVVNSIGSDDDPDLLTDAQRDSIAAAEEKAEKEAAKLDTAANDPHKREYYLAQIPFTEEQLQESNEQIKDGLYHSGIIFKDKLDNLPLSEKAFTRLMRQFPDIEQKDEVYYHMFLLYSREGKPDMAKSYLSKLKTECPQSKWTTILTDPYFEENARYGKHLEDSLYAATYEAFQHDRFEEVKQNTKLSDTRFVLGENRDKFLFISGLSLLNEGDADGCIERLDTLVKAFPQSKVSELAGMIINGVKQGRTLRGGNFNMTDVWNRRTAVMNDQDSTATKGFSDERNTQFTFMFVYNPNSLNENRLLFQLARFNFSSFVVRNFNIEITDAEGMHRMMVAGFRSYDEARQYARVLYQSDAVMGAAKGARGVVISDLNLPMLGTQFSYNDYDKFYTEHFQPMKLDKVYMLYEPDDNGGEAPTTKDIAPTLPDQTVAPKGVAPVKESTTEESGNPDDNFFGVGTNEDNSIKSQIEDITVPEEKAETSKEEENIIVPTEENTGVSKQEDNIIVPTEEKTEEKKVEEDNIIVPTNEKADTPKQDENIIIPTEEKSTEKKEDDNTVIFDEKSIEKKEDKNQEDTVVFEDKTTEDKKTNDANDIIIFEDSKKEDTPKSEDEIILDEGKKEDSKKLEDEYYELDGF